MERKARTTMNKKMVMQIKSNIDAGKSLVDISKSLLISYSSVRSVAKKILTIPDFVENFKPAHERINQRQNGQDIHQLVSDILTSENETTQKEVVQELRNMQIAVSQPTVSRILKKINFTRKRLTLVPIERNTPQLIELRRTYARSLGLVQNQNLIFLDEAGFSGHTARHYGYSQVGTKATKCVRANRGQNVSLLSMIKINGTYAYKVHQGAINAQILHDFLQEHLEETPLNQPQKTLVMDNVKFHHSNIIKSLCAEKRIQIKYLPAYSPQLNPIEEYFSIVKSKFKSLRMAKNTFNQIKQCIDISIFDINSEIYNNLYINMRRWIDRALAGELFI